MQNNIIIKGAASFRHNQIKNEVDIAKAVSISFFFENLGDINVENLRFSSFHYSFLFYRRFLARRTFVRLSLVSRRFLLKIKRAPKVLRTKNSDFITKSCKIC